MTTTDLVHALLYEAGLDKLATEAKRRLAATEFGALEVGVDTGPRPIAYVESWSHEHSFVALRVESIGESHREEILRDLLDD